MTNTTIYVVVGQPLYPPLQKEPESSPFYKGGSRGILDRACSPNKPFGCPGDGVRPLHRSVRGTDPTTIGGVQSSSLLNSEL